MGGKSMKIVPRVIVARLLIVSSLTLGCQTITEMTRIESDKDAAISKAVRENFLKDKAVDLTRVDVKTTNGSVDLEGYRDLTGSKRNAVKLAWRVAGVQSVVNHLVVQK
jgi:osmotically-inducible protein OsmY